MQQNLSINHQDGTIYFEKFRTSEIVTYPDENNQLVVNINVKTYDGPYSEIELNDLPKGIGKVKNDIEYCWVELRDYKSSKLFNELIQNTINFKEGYNINESEGHSIAHCYFGWSIELNHNVINFKRIDNVLFLEWSATSNDVDYYDERAKENKFTLCTKLTEHHLNSRIEYEQHVQKNNSKQDKYFSILRLFSNTAIEKDNKYDISLLNSSDSHLRNSFIAWNQMDKVIIKENTEIKKVEVKNRKWWKL